MLSILHSESEVMQMRRVVIDMQNALFADAVAEALRRFDPDSPQTGDNSMMVLWIALFVVSGAGATAIYSRKRKSSAK